MSTVTFIDPGTSKSAIVVWDGTRVLMHSILDNEAMRRLIYDRMVPPDEIFAIERIRHQGVAIGAEVLDTAEWTGRFAEAHLLAAKQFPLLIPRMTIKMHHCGRSTNDAGVRSALIERFGEPGKKASPGVLYGIIKDEWQALAGAVYVYDTRCAQVESWLQ